MTRGGGAAAGGSTWSAAARIGLLAALCVLSGCSTMFTRDVKFDTPTLPVPAVDRVPVRIGVVFSEQLRTARIETSELFLGDRYTWRYDLGEALVAAIRQTLVATFAEVVELPRLPAPDSGRMNDLAAVLVPALPVIRTVMPPDSVVWLYRQNLVLALALHGPDGDRVAEWAVEGFVGTGAHGPIFTQQKMLNEALLRSTMAALVVSIHREPALAALRGTVQAAPVPRAAETSEPAGAVVVLRLDAGLPRDDGIERRVADCLGPLLRPTRGLLASDQPSAALRDALFPWFDPGVAPRASEDVQAVLALPRVRERLRALGVGQLVLVAAHDRPRSEENSLACFGGYNAAACVGNYSSSSGYVLDLKLWDADAHATLGAGVTDFSRKLGVLGVVFPIPYTSSNAVEYCERMREVARKSLPVQ